MKQGILSRTVLTVVALLQCDALLARQNCSNTSVGFTPLAELGTGLYKGYSGGLYPNGQNQRPATHDSVGRALAQQIKPLNSSGAEDLANGKIVLVSIGMSNTTQEFSTFLAIANADPVKNPQLFIVDGAQGGQTASAISDPNANFWTVVEQRLAAAGVTGQQVLVAWVKEANAGPTQAFPVHAQMLQGNYESIARILKVKFPNIKIAYYSSRIYGGYASTTLNPEPYAYESGFAVKWLIEKQVNGDSTLAATGSNPQAPWLAWGPYLWADGMIQRIDGLIWQCTDFQSDGTHPSTSGRQKVADLLLNFLKTDPTATSWFLQPSVTIAEEQLRSVPSEFDLYQNYPNPFNPETVIRFSLPNNSSLYSVSLKVYNLLGQEVATLVDGQQGTGFYEAKLDGRNLTTGAYFYRIVVSGGTKESVYGSMKRMMLLR
ncbi:MAG: T9SS type A sorting domain-containing protein [Ignavibacteriales bacterium]|nr:T9SS type A sorting domain-containing protein [Ignavibacteriales bacterium]